MYKVIWVLTALYASTILSLFLNGRPGYSGPFFDTQDFANYWIAAKVFFEGDINTIFHKPLFMEHLRLEFGADYPIHAWSYPPSYLLFCLPLYLFSYEWAFAFFAGTTFLLFIYSANRFVAEFASETFGHRSPWRELMFTTLVATAVVVNFGAAQNGFLTSALFLLGLAHMRARPVLAGVCFGLLTIKPQLGILIPVLLLFDRNWTAIASAAATALGLIALSAIVVGLEAWVQYLTVTLDFQSRVLTDAGSNAWFYRMMFSGYTAARMYDIDGAAAWLVHAIFAVPALVVTIWTFKVERSPAIRACVLVLATFVVTPYAFNYDAGVLSTVAAVLTLMAMRERAGAPGSMTDVFSARMRLAGIAATIPVTGYLANMFGWTIAPLLLLVALFAHTPLATYLRFGITRDAPGRSAAN